MSETISKSVQGQQDEQQKEQQADEQAKKDALIAGLDAFIGGKQFDDKLVNSIESGLNSITLSNEEIKKTEKKLEEIIQSDSKKKETDKSKLASTFLQKLKAMEIVNNIPNEIQTIKDRYGFYSYKMARYIKDTFDNEEVISRFCDKFEEPTKASLTPEEQQLFINSFKLIIPLDSNDLQDKLISLQNTLGKSINEISVEASKDDIIEYYIHYMNGEKLKLIVQSLAGENNNAPKLLCEGLENITTNVFAENHNIFNKFGVEDKKEICDRIVNGFFNGLSKINIGEKQYYDIDDGNIDEEQKKSITDNITILYQQAQNMELQKQLKDIEMQITKLSREYNQQERTDSNIRKQYESTIEVLQKSVENLQMQLDQTKQQLDQTIQEKNRLVLENSGIQDGLQTLQNFLPPEAFRTPDNTKSIVDNQDRNHMDRSLTVDDLNASSVTSGVSKSGVIIDNVSGFIQSQSKENADLRATVAVQQSEIVNLTNRNQRLQDENGSLMTKLNNSEAIITKKDQQLQDIGTQNNHLLSENNQLKRTSTKMQMQYESTIFDLKGTRKQLQAELNDAQTQLTTLRGQVNSLIEDKAKLQTMNTELTTRLEQVQEQDKVDKQRLQEELQQTQANLAIAQAVSSFLNGEKDPESVKNLVNTISDNIGNCSVDNFTTAMDLLSEERIKNVELINGLESIKAKNSEINKANEKRVKSINESVETTINHINATEVADKAIMDGVNTFLNNKKETYDVDELSKVISDNISNCSINGFKDAMESLSKVDKLANKNVYDRLINNLENRKKEISSNRDGEKISFFIDYVGSKLKITQVNEKSDIMANNQSIATRELEKRIQKFDRQKKEEQEKLQQLESQLQQKRDEIDRLNRELKQQKEKDEKDQQEYQQEIKNSQRVIKQKEQRITDLQKANKQYKSEQRQFQNQVNSLTDKNSTLATQLQQVQDTLQQTEEQKEQLQNENNGLQEQLRQERGANAAAQAKIAEQDEELIEEEKYNLMRAGANAIKLEEEQNKRAVVEAEKEAMQKQLTEAQEQSQLKEQRLQEQDQQLQQERDANATALAKQKQTYEQQLAEKQREINDRDTRITELNQQHQEETQEYNELLFSNMILKDQLKDQQREITARDAEIARQNTTIDEKDAEIAKLRKRSENKDKRIEKLEKNLEKSVQGLSQDVIELGGQNQQLWDKLVEQVFINKIQSEQLKTQQERLGTVEETLQQAQQERDANAIALEEERTKQQQLTQQLEEKQRKIDDRDTRINELNQQHQEEIGKKDAENTRLRQQIEDTKRKADKTINQFATDEDVLLNTISDLKTDISLKESKFAIANEKITVLTQRLEEKQREIDDRDTRINELNQQHQEETQEYNELLFSNTILKDQLRDQQREITEVRERLAQLTKKKKQVKKIVKKIKRKNVYKQPVMESNEVQQKQNVQIEAEKTAKTIKLKVGEAEFDVELNNEGLVESFKGIFGNEQVEVADIFQKANEYVNGLEEKKNQDGLEALYGILNGLSGKNDSLKKAIQDDGKTLEAFKKLNDNLKKDETRYNKFRIAALQQLTVVGEMQKAMEFANILGMELIKDNTVDKGVQAEIIQNKAEIQTVEDVQTVENGAQTENEVPADEVVKKKAVVSRQPQIEMISNINDEEKQAVQPTPMEQPVQSTNRVVLDMKATPIIAAEKSEQQDSVVQGSDDLQKTLKQALDNPAKTITPKNKTVKKGETFVYYKCMQKKEGKEEDIGLKTELRKGDFEGVTFPIELQIESKKATLGEVVAYAKSVLESMNQEVNSDNVMKMLDLQGQGIGEKQLKAAKVSIANEIKKFASEGVGLTEELLKKEAISNPGYSQVAERITEKTKQLAEMKKKKLTSRIVNRVREKNKESEGRAR